MRLAENRAIRRRTDSIAKTVSGMVQERGAKEPIPVGEPSHIDQVVHATGHDRIDRATLRVPSVQVGGLAGPGFLDLDFSWKDFVGLFCEGGFGPVDPTVGT